MSDLTSTGGVEGWIRRTERRLRSAEQALGRGRIPRVCTSDQRPRADRLQPGVRVFEADTNRSIFVNASQTGWVNALGVAV